MNKVNTLKMYWEMFTFSLWGIIILAAMITGKLTCYSLNNHIYIIWYPVNSSRDLFKSLVNTRSRISDRHITVFLCETLISYFFFWHEKSQCLILISVASLCFFKIIKKPQKPNPKIFKITKIRVSPNNSISSPSLTIQLNKTQAKTLEAEMECIWQM